MLQVRTLRLVSIRCPPLGDGRAPGTQPWHHQLRLPTAEWGIGCQLMVEPSQPTWSLHPSTKVTSACVDSRFTMCTAWSSLQLAILTPQEKVGDRSLSWSPSLCSELEQRLDDTDGTRQTGYLSQRAGCAGLHGRQPLHVVGKVESEQDETLAFVTFIFLCF